MKLDFEFVSTHRNRNLWPSPCLFEVPWSGSGQLNGLNSLDPTSLQAPIVAWTGQNINTAVTVVSQTNIHIVTGDNQLPSTAATLGGAGSRAFVNGHMKIWNGSKWVPMDVPLQTFKGSNPAMIQLHYLEFRERIRRHSLIRI